ncbi:hypothetical protein BOSE127_50061 [Bosea sp. 127]|nr:hypothetical protein BOSE7B_40354 [Bosea sp. 7B]VXC77504.1 hypothetical protein BOSE127_50061 [Bosea sp. 127]
MLAMPVEEMLRATIAWPEVVV